MKHLIKFEELNKLSYISAADKLKKKLGTTKRVEDLYNHANRFDNKPKKIDDSNYKYNMILNNGDHIKSSISKKEINFYIDDEHVNTTVDILEDANVEQAVKEFIDHDSSHMDFTIQYSFDYIDEGGKRGSGDLLSFKVELYRFEFAPDILFYTDDIIQSLFSDRKSANIFLKEFKEDISKIDISTILTTIGIEADYTKQLEQFYKMLDNIDIHKLYSPTVLSDNIYDRMGYISIIKD